MKFKKLAVVLIPVTFLTCFTSVTPVQAVNDGFDSPEDAIEYLISEIQSNDLNGALEAFPITHISTDFNFDGYTELSGSWYWNTPLVYPPNCQLAIEMNKHQLTARYRKELNHFIFSFLADSAFLDENLLSLDSTNIVGLMESIDFDKLASLEILRVDYVKPDLQNEECIQEDVHRISSLYGFDSIEEYTVLYTIGDGELFGSGLSVVRYGDRYYLYNLGSIFWGGYYEWHAMPITEEEYMQCVETGDFPHY